MTRTSRRSGILGCSVAGVLAASSLLRAAAFSWDGGGTALANDISQWNDPNNWSPNGAPNLSSDVTFATGFASGHNISLVANFGVNSLTINTTTGFSIFSSLNNPNILLFIQSGDITRNDVAGTEAAQFINSSVVINQSGVWDINGSNSLTVDRVYENFSGLSINKTGSGTLVLGALGPDSTYSGGTSVNDGVLRLQADGAAGTGSITVASGAALTFDNAAIANHVNVSGSGVSGNGAIRSISNGFIHGTVRFDSNVTIGVNDGAALIMNGVISDGASSFALTKVGNGDLDLTAANTYGGLTLINNGRVFVEDNNALGNGSSVIVASGTSLGLDGNISINKTVFLNGSGPNGEGSLFTAAGNNTWAGNVALQSNSSIGGGFAGTSLTISGVISGGFSLTKVDAGRVTLSGANTYTGATNINAGALRIRHSTALGSGDITVSNGATLELAELAPGLPINVFRTLHLRGSGESNHGALRNISSNNNWLGNIIFDNDATIGVDAGTLSIFGATSGFFDLTKVGLGTLVLTSAANSHADTIIDEGIVRMTSPNPFPLVGVIIVHSGGMADLQGGAQMSRNLRLNGTGIGNAGALHSISSANGWTLPVTLFSDSSIGVDADELRITGVISGAGALTKVGAGKLTLAAANTYAGNTTVAAGALSVEHSSALPTPATVSAGASIELRGGVAPSTALGLNGPGFLNAGALRNVFGNNTWAGAITLASVDASVAADAGTQLTISAAISDGTSLFPLTKTGAGTLVLSSANTYDGGTLINGGTLQISADNALGTAAGTVATNNGGKLLIAGNTATSRTFNLNNGSLQVNSGATLQYNNATVNGGFLRGPGTHQINAGSSFNGVTALNGNSIVQSQPTTLVNFTNAGSLLSSAALTWDGGFNTPAGNITVNSAFNTQAFENDGIMTINSGGNVTNTASSFVSGAGGRITINPGGQLNAGPSLELGASLLVNNGTITGTTNVNFLALAKGSGTYGPVNVLDGGRFSPGNSPGTVSTGSTTWNAGGSYVVEIGQSAHDFWQINGQLIANSSAAHPFIIALEPLDDLIFDPARDQTWNILHADGGIAGFDDSELALDISGFKQPLGTGKFSLETTQTDLIVHFSPVPEPAAMFAFLEVALITNRRRVRHHTDRTRV